MGRARIQLGEGFDPWALQAISHQLSEHPLLQIDALVALGLRQEKRGLVRTHSDHATPATDFGDAPNLHPNDKSAEQTLSDMENAHAWMSLLNVQADPVYRRFIDEILYEVRPIVDRRDPGMCYRAGWIFVSSPNAVTPFHMDHEHNLIMQIRGNKRLYAWDPFDRAVVPERGHELFHDAHSRELVVWRDELRDKARMFDLEPGMGGYMPSTSPHLVQNGDGVSITMSFTYYTDATRRRELLYRGNARLRRLGLEPSPVGESMIRDGVKHGVLGLYTSMRHRVRRALGYEVRPSDVPYAPA